MAGVPATILRRRQLRRAAASQPAAPASRPSQCDRMSTAASAGAAPTRGCNGRGARHRADAAEGQAVPARPLDTDTGAPPDRRPYRRPPSRLRQRRGRPATPTRDKRLRHLRPMGHPRRRVSAGTPALRARPRFTSYMPGRSSASRSSRFARRATGSASRTYRWPCRVKCLQ